MGKRRLKKRKIPKVSSMSEFIVDDEDDSYNPKEYPGSEYFDLDTSDLQRELINAMANSFNLFPEDVSQVISQVFRQVGPHMLDDYFGAKPSKESWKIGTDAKTVKKVESEFLKIREEIENEVPTVPKIMSANVTRDDKKQCLKLFDQLNNVEPYSSDYFRLIESINEILGKSRFYSKKEIDFLQNEEEKLKVMYVSPESMKTKILKLDAEPHIKAQLLSKYDEMITYPSDSPFYLSLKEEIEWSLKLPYEKREEDVRLSNKELNGFYCKIRRQLDKELYGMEKVKNRIIHVLNDRRSSGDECGRNIALVGNPGVGKTQICKALAKILGKKFAKISGGSLDSGTVKGSDKVWTGATPSIILQIMARLKTNNPIIMIDEPDRLDSKAQNALLHILDPSDNNQFQDGFLNSFTHDLSNILFIVCMNSADGLDPALRDRLDIISVDDYRIDEKVEIFKNYMLPKALRTVGLGERDVLIADSAIRKLLEKNPDYTLRTVEKIIKDLVEKVNMYKSVILPDGTTGDLELPYSIPNFKFPLKIDTKLLFHLTNS